MTVPVIVVTGTVGVGKSTVAEAMHHTLEQCRISHGCVDVGTSRQWHLARTVELDAILDDAQVADFEVDNGDRLLTDVATEVLVRAGWIDQADKP